MSCTIRLAKPMVIYPSLISKLQEDNKISQDPDDDTTNFRYITNFMDQETAAPIYHAWQGIVSYYSSRDLTQIADKLSALAGLARLISEALSVESGSYLAGHWKEDLISSLLWYVSSPKTPNRSTPYRAPRWSWASVNGQINYFREGYQFHFVEAFTIQEAHCKSSPLDAFRRITYGRLRVTDLFVPALLHIAPTQCHRIQYTGGGGCAGHAYSDQFSWVTSVLPDDKTKCVDRPIFYEVLMDDKMSSGSSFSEPCFCLLVGNHYDTATGGARVWWLVLRCLSQKGNSYQRIGIGYYQEYTRSLHLFDTCSVETSQIILL